MFRDPQSVIKFYKICFLRIKSRCVPVNISHTLWNLLAWSSAHASPSVGPTHSPNTKLQKETEMLRNQDYSWTYWWTMNKITSIPRRFSCSSLSVWNDYRTKQKENQNSRTPVLVKEIDKEVPSLQTKTRLNLQHAFFPLHTSGLSIFVSH